MTLAHRTPRRPGVRPARAAPDGPAATIKREEVKTARRVAIAAHNDGEARLV